MNFKSGSSNIIRRETGLIWISLSELVSWQRKPGRLRAIRALEIGRDRPDEIDGSFEENKDHLTEELGDVLGNLIVIANKYDITLEDIFRTHQQKLAKRYT